MKGNIVLVIRQSKQTKCDHSSYSKMHLTSKFESIQAHSTKTGPEEALNGLEETTKSEKLFKIFSF